MSTELETSLQAIVDTLVYDCDEQPDYQTLYDTIDSAREALLKVITHYA